MNISIDQKLAQLEKRTSRLRLLCWLQLGLLFLVLFSILNQRVQTRSAVSVLRLKGIVIEDQLGRPRILLGAPFPTVKQRQRQDSTTTSMVFLDGQGHDRLTLGEEPEPQVGGKVSKTEHRIASGFGVVIHDGEGNERGAYGWLDNGRALITLDRPGVDAWGAIVDDKTGFAGMRIEYARDIAPDSNGIELGTSGSNAYFDCSTQRKKNVLPFSSAAMEPLPSRPGMAPGARYVRSNFQTLRSEKMSDELAVRHCPLSMSAASASSTT